LWNSDLTTTSTHIAKLHVHSTHLFGWRSGFERMDLEKFEWIVCGW